MSSWYTVSLFFKIHILLTFHLRPFQFSSLSKVLNQFLIWHTSVQSPTTCMIRSTSYERQATPLSYNREPYPFYLEYFQGLPSDLFTCISLPSTFAICRLPLLALSFLCPLFPFPWDLPSSSNFLPFSSRRAVRSRSGRTCTFLSGKRAWKENKAKGRGK